MQKIAAIKQAELLRELNRIAKPDRFHCLGCGHEHNCSIHGCAVIWAAVREIQIMALDNFALRHDLEAVRRGGDSLEGT